MKTIKLYNREGLNVSLIPFSPYSYKLELPYNVYIRLNSRVDDVKFIDPSGGPMIKEGEYIPDTKLLVKKIRYDEVEKSYIISVEK